MRHIKNSKKKRMFAAILAVIIILAMVIPMAMYAFG